MAVFYKRRIGWEYVDLSKIASYRIGQVPWHLGSEISHSVCGVTIAGHELVLEKYRGIDAALTAIESLVNMLGTIDEGVITLDGVVCQTCEV